MNWNAEDGPLDSILPRSRELDASDVCENVNANGGYPDLIGHFIARKRHRSDVVRF